MEMTHRYMASLLGLSIVIQAVLLWPRYLGAVRYLSIFLCLWVVMQGLFGTLMAAGSECSSVRRCHYPRRAVYDLASVN